MLEIISDIIPSMINNQRKDLLEYIHGFKISDPYRWLEDITNPQVKEWNEEQNKQTESELVDDSFKTISKELVDNISVDNYTNPVLLNGKYYYRKKLAGEDQMSVYYKEGLDGNEVCILSVDKKTESIDYWFVTLKGKYLIYGISENGDELATLYIKEISTGKILENITNCRYSRVKTLNDESGFYYTRNARPGTVPEAEMPMHSKLYFHVIGTDPEKDEMIFGKDRPKDDILSPSLSQDDKYLAIGVSQLGGKNDVFIYNTETKETVELIINYDSKFFVRFLKDKVLIFTNYKANNNRVLWNTYEDLFSPIEKWEEFIPEKEDLLKSMSCSKDKVILEYIHNVNSKVEMLDHDGNTLGDLPLSLNSSIKSITTNIHEKEFFYDIASFLYPSIKYRLNPETDTFEVYQKMNNPINPEEYISKQEWCTSKDGTKIPMFIVHKKDLKMDGTNPTVLYGYGGFGHPQTPGFIQNYIPWIERGGIYALSNIRGGGEFGKDWHKGGIGKNKQTSYNDFIACAEHLISTKYTSSQNLGILGGSNGGLLVSSVAAQRPDLFNSVCSSVPLTDMVRFSKFGMAVRWTHEYGNPDKKEDLENIIKWSPYHNIKENIEYPSFLFITGEKDSRVDPLHARKMTAILQDTNKENDVLIYTEIDAGHGAGKPMTKKIKARALIINFFSKRLGLDI
jgi:prolyl oligopeptidase